MTQFSKPLQWIYCIYAFVLFVTIMLLLFPCVLIASFFGRIRGGNAIFRICMFWGDLWFPLVFIFPRRIYTSPHDKTKQYVFVLNHTSLLDAAFRIAIETQTPVKPVLFLDNFNRLPYQHALSFNPGRCRILFLDEIPVSGLTAHDADKLKENVFHMMENKLREYKVGWIR